jgi:hypothetical protein
MKYLKRFNENMFKDIINYPSKKFAEGREKYFLQFKKDYEERTHAENIIVQGLYYVEYVLDGSSKDELRYLGAIEAVLVLEKFLKPDNKFNYKEKENKFLFFTFKTKESYRDVILRNAKEYLKQKGVL